MTVRGLFAGCLVALAAVPCLAGDVRVAITSPVAGESVAGTVTVAAEVAGADAISHLEFRVDGRVAGRATPPPWELAVDVGLDNVAHRFEVVAFTAAGEAARAAVVTPHIHVDEEVSFQLQQLYVTASRADRRVDGLDRGDFSVFDDGDKQELITFERGDVPFTAVILIGATAFLAAGDPRAQALDGVEADGGTALNDQLYVSLHLLEQRQGRRVIIMLTDGLDSHSVLAIDDVLPLAGRSRALLYWVRLVKGGPTSPDLDPRGQHSAWRDGSGHRRQIEALERAVVNSGGRVAMIRSAEEMAPTFTGILAELREQYVLGYYPSGARNDGAWHAVKVKTPFAGVEIRAASGYLDY